MTDSLDQQHIHSCNVVNVQFGKNVSYINPCNLYECIIGSNVFIGPFVEIQSGAVIGNRTRISSHSFICSKVHIGDDCFIAHGVMFTNDLFRDGSTNNDSATWKETHVGNNVCIGSGSVLLPVSICDHVVIGAGSIVTKDINESGIYAGNPAIKLRNFC